MFSIQTETNINELLLQLPPVLKLKENVLTDLAEIVRKDIEQNLITGTGIDGVGLTAKKKGGRLFYETGELLRSVMKRTTTNEAEIYIHSNRSLIASVLNYGNSRIPERRFFGIGNRVQLEIDKYFLTKDFKDTFEQRF